MEALQHPSLVSAADCLPRLNLFFFNACIPIGIPTTPKSNWVAGSSSNYIGTRNTEPDFVIEEGIEDDYWGPDDPGGLVNPWWSVDLGIEEEVLEIKMEARYCCLDRLSGVEIRVGNMDPVTNAVDGEPFKYNNNIFNTLSFPFYM